MKGIILAGGAGSRLYPLSLAASKQLQHVYDKPMIYYPLTTLIECGIKDIAIITTPEDAPAFKRLLARSSEWGVNLTFLEQPNPNGLAEAYIIAEQFIDSKPSMLILGDNIFSSAKPMKDALKNDRWADRGSIIFAYPVSDPERYGIVTLDGGGGVVSLVEKPFNAGSSLAVPGVYICDGAAPAVAKILKPSYRGELEIISLLQTYQGINALQCYRLPRGFAWLDAGTSSSLHDSASYVQTIEHRCGIKLGCPEEAAFYAGFMTLRQLDDYTHSIPLCEYRKYLEKIVLTH